ncbi:MAG TPA: sulfite exporter TauE/SafE family protein [Methanoregulaceae archaeon]|nr:sulfite exporter TauE/SafE family protein [Methanoregulaceae archaeon]
MIEYALALLIAIGIGIIAAILGVGGGFLMVPAFTILFSLDQKTAVGTSLAVIVATSLSGTIAYARQGRIFYRAALVVIIPGVIGAVIGGLLTAVLSATVLALIFAGVIIFFAFVMMTGDRNLIVPLTFGPYFLETCNDRFSQCVEMRMYYLHLVLWGFASGIIGAVCGQGGGVINVPSLFILGMPIHFAVATSTCIIFFTSLAGALTHLLLGHIAPLFFVIFAAGGFAGAQLGSRMAPGISATSLKKIIGVVFLLIGISVVVKTMLG